MSMYRVFSCVVWRGCLLWPVHFLGKTLFNSEESLRRNGVAIMVNKRVWNAVLGCNLKNDRICSFPRQTIQYHDNPSLCPNQYHWRSWSWTVLWRPTRPFRTNTQKRCPFHYRGLECKSRKSRNTWSNRQIWPWNTEWSRAKTYTPIIGAPK